MLALPGVQRATWWANCVPFREDLPRRLPEFAVLGVYEADRDFEAPKGAGSVPDDITGYCFDHYGRPGQGTLSDKPTLGIELVLISAPTADQSQTLRDWGDFIHIRDIAAGSPPHFTMITPYENRAEGSPCDMHFYELDTNDPEPAFRGMAPATVARTGAYGTHSVEEWKGAPDSGHRLRKHIPTARGPRPSQLIDPFLSTGPRSESDRGKTSFTILFLWGCRTRAYSFTRENNGRCAWPVRRLAIRRTLVTSK